MSGGPGGLKVWASVSPAVRAALKSERPYRDRPVYKTLYIPVWVWKFSKTLYIPNVIYTGWLQQIFSEIISKLVFLKECGAARRHQKMLDTFWYLYMTFYWILDQFRSVQSTIIVNSYGARYRKSFLYTPQPVYLTLYIPSGKEKFLKFSKNVIYTERYIYR